MSNGPMKKQGQKRVVRQRKRRGLLLFVKVFMLLLVAGNLGVLVWYLSEHPLQLRIGGGGRALSARPGRLDFGEAEPGETLALGIMIRNRTSSELDVQVIDFTNASFRLRESGRNLVIPARGSAELTVIYEPQSGGVSEGEMCLRLRGASSPDLVVPLRGEASLPALALSTSKLDFGDVKTRGGARLPLMIRNDGNKPLTITAVAAYGEGFGLARPFAPVTIGPKESLTVEVAFVPTKMGASVGTLAVTSNDPSGRERTVTLAASYGATARKQHDKTAALALLAEAKRELNTAYTYLTSESTNKSLKRDHHRMGREALEKAWPKYEHANEILRSIDPALEDKEFYLDGVGELRRRTPGAN